MAGAEVVLLFAAPPGAGAGGRPAQTLAQFDRVWLEPGQRITVSLAVPAARFALANTDGTTRALAAGDWRFWVGSEGAGDATVLTIQ